MSVSDLLSRVKEASVHIDIKVSRGLQLAALGLGPLDVVLD